MEIFNILKNTPSIRAAIVSITSASTGSLLDLLKVNSVDQALQRAAWTIAILAGIVAICNGVKQWFINKGCKDAKDAKIFSGSGSGSGGDDRV